MAEGNDKPTAPKQREMPKTPAPKPSAPGKDLKAKKKADLNELILKRHRAGIPRNKAAGTYEVISTEQGILSAINYTLDLGIEPFDDLVGGLPFGRLCEIYGLESCGKSQLVIRAAGRAVQKFIRAIQRSGPSRKVDPKKVYVHVLYIDNEQSIDDDEKIMVDGQRLKVELVRCDNIDQLLKIVDTSICTVREAQQKDKEVMYFVFIVTDTIAAVPSKEEMVQEWGKVDYSRMPKTLREGFRIMTRDLSRANACWVCTNQVGDAMKSAQGNGHMGGRKIRHSTPQADDFNAPGGKALKFFATHRIFMFKVRDFKLYPKTQFPSGMVIGFRSEKNRVKKPKREGRMVLLYGDEEGKGGGFDNLFSKLETMIFMKAVKMGESGVGLAFRFQTFGIETKTFDPAELEKSLDEQDDSQGSGDEEEESSIRNPTIRYRGDFPAWYEKHKADCDALYAACIKAAFAAETAPTGQEGDQEELVAEEDM